MNFHPRTGRQMNLRFLACTVTVGLVMVAGLAMAQSGGLSLPEDGGPLNGTAQAGSAAIARDAQTAWTNPAGMTRLTSSEIMLTFQPINMKFEFQPGPENTVSGSSGGDQGGWLPGGSLFFATPVSEKVALGFSATSPAGLILEPEIDWVGRYYMTKTQLVALNFEPSIGFKLGEQWSVGGGIDIQYARFEQEIAVRMPGPTDGSISIDGDSWQLGFSLATLFEPSSDTRLGLKYRSEVDHALAGDLEGLQNSPVSTGLLMPQNLTMSVYHHVSQTTALMLDVGWHDWSAFDRTVITVDETSGLQVEIPRNFKDTWTAALGAHFQTSEKWLLMGGAGYTSAAVEDADRTPDMPVDAQWRLSAGAEFVAGERWRIGGNYTYLDLGDNSLDASQIVSLIRVVGDYTAYVHILGFYASFRF